MKHHLRHSMCNEAFQGWDFAAACRTMRQAGYEGIEIAPFTLAESPAAITAAERRNYRDIMAGEGLVFAGLHWLMVSPKGLHVTSADAALRERSWRHIRDLIDLAADLGPDSVMVFGSPQQRATTPGTDRATATGRYRDGLAAVAPHAAARGVKVLVEALPIGQCDVVQTLDEAAAIVAQIGSPAIQTMFDVHNAIDEAAPHAELVERHCGVIRHVHVNELDGKHCGQGHYDFAPVLAALLRLRYAGWVSLEAFDFSFGPERIANESIQHLRRVIEELPA